jgi:GNAT superfamily N-acetyltransferase
MAVTFDIAKSGYDVRAATETDAKSVRMLVPEVGDTAAAWVAIDGRHRLVVAAAALTRIPRRVPLVGPGFAVHVIAPCRRHGLASRLTDEAKRTARAARAGALYAVQRVAEGSDAMTAWQQLGFRVCQTVEGHTLPLEQFEPQLGPLLDRMRNKGRIPQAARIVPLYEVDAAAVAKLHRRYMGGSTTDIERKIRGEAAGAYHPRYSKVLLVDETIKGCILAHRAGPDTAIVDANIVDDSVRGGWANVWLKLEATRGALSLGIKNFEFTSFDHYTDTRRFTAKLGGRTLRKSALMYHPLD